MLDVIAHRQRLIERLACEATAKQKLEHLRGLRERD
jgi:hypothetical protein